MTNKSNNSQIEAIHARVEKNLNGVVTDLENLLTRIKRMIDRSCEIDEASLEVVAEVSSALAWGHTKLNGRLINCMHAWATAELLLRGDNE